MHTRLQVQLNRGWGGARSGTGCPPSKSSGAEVYVYIADDRRGILSFYARHYALSRDTPFKLKRYSDHSAVYHRKLGPGTIH